MIIKGVWVSQLGIRTWDILILEKKGGPFRRI